MQTLLYDPLIPTPSLVITLGSMIIHAEEFISPDGDPVDKMTFERQLATPEVQEWIAAMNKMAYLPVKRVQ